ncbi:MAG: Gfo/Idh/MocA family oxidoreductase [Bacteroidales bacterium]
MQNRREFLKALSAFTGASLVLSSLPWLEPLRAAASESTQSGGLVRLGIIGTGSRAMYLMEFLKDMPGVEISALCDDYAPHLQDALKITGGKAQIFSDYRRLLEIKEIDAVLVTVPLHLHALITIDSLKAGKHVFCE